MNKQSENRFIVVWKPRCYSGTKSGKYERNSSLESCLPLFEKIVNEGGIIFGLFNKEAKIKNKYLINMNDINNREQREKFIFLADYKCKFTISGQTGGITPLTIFETYNGLRCCISLYISFLGSRTIIYLQKATYKDGEPVDLKTLVN